MTASLALPSWAGAETFILKNNDPFSRTDAGSIEVFFACGVTLISMMVFKICTLLAVMSTD